MRLKIQVKLLLISMLLHGFLFAMGTDIDAKEIVRKSDQRLNGEKSSISTMSMTIVRPKWERTIQFKNWNKGSSLNMTLINAPSKDKGQVFLKLEKEMWNWNPRISRMIKLPPSMMSQGWMGSDYTNDDLMKESSIVVDYDHKIIGEENIAGYDCYKIEMIPHEDANVVWGKIELWVSKKEYLQLKGSYYDEDGYLVRSMIGSEVKEVGGRILPTKLELIPEEEEGNKTLLHIEAMEFNVPIEDKFFSQQNMKRIR